MFFFFLEELEGKGEGAQNLALIPLLKLVLTLFLISAGQYPRNYSCKLPADFFSLLFLEILGLICALLCALFSFFCFVSSLFFFFCMRLSKVVFSHSNGRRTIFLSLLL